MSSFTPKTPVWMTVLILIVLFPVCSLPTMIANLPANDETIKTFLWIYPFYMILSAWLAWSAYPSRPYVSWILLLLMAMSTAALWYVILNPDTLA